MAAEKFGCRPSQMVGLCDPVLALDFDLAAVARLLVVERAAATAMTEGFEGSAPGQQSRSVYW
jgi:hypothetical protein